MVCSPGDAKQLRAAVMAAGCTTISSEVELRPINRIEVPQNDRDILTKAYTLIQEHEYVEHIIDNVTWPDQHEKQKATA